jgi:hypothetical protein
MKFDGVWYITEMENWDEDYFNMQVQAYFEIDERGSGNFQFDLVSGSIDGQIAINKSGEKLEFTWEGRDENDKVNGSGWLRLKDDDTLEGKIKSTGEIVLYSWPSELKVRQSIV